MSSIFFQKCIYSHTSAEKIQILAFPSPQPDTQHKRLHFLTFKLETWFPWWDVWFESILSFSLARVSQTKLLPTQMYRSSLIKLLGLGLYLNYFLGFTLFRTCSQVASKMCRLISEIYWLISSPPWLLGQRGLGIESGVSHNDLMRCGIIVNFF